MRWRGDRSLGQPRALQPVPDRFRHPGFAERHGHPFADPGITIAHECNGDTDRRGLVMRVVRRHRRGGELDPWQPVDAHRPGDSGGAASLLRAVRP